MVSAGNETRVRIMKDLCSTDKYSEKCCGKQPKTVVAAMGGLSTNALISVMLAFGLPRSAAKMIKSGLEIVKDKTKESITLDKDESEDWVTFPGVNKNYGDDPWWRVDQHAYKGVNDATNWVASGSKAVVEFSQKNAKTIGWIALCATGSTVFPAIIVVCMVKLAVDIAETAVDIKGDGNQLVDAAWTWYKCGSNKGSCKPSKKDYCPRIDEAMANTDYMQKKM